MPARIYETPRLADIYHTLSPDAKEMILAIAPTVGVLAEEFRTSAWHGVFFAAEILNDPDAIWPSLSPDVQRKVREQLGAPHEYQGTMHQLTPEQQEYPLLKGSTILMVLLEEKAA